MLVCQTVAVNNQEANEQQEVQCSRGWMKIVDGRERAPRRSYTLPVRTHIVLRNSDLQDQQTDLVPGMRQSRAS